jgi:hypothetical protein
MQRLLSGLFLFAALGWAQMRDLATTFDGGVVHFATDMRLAGTLDGPQGKIYKWEGGKFSAVISPNVTPLGFRSVNAFGPVISQDGATFGHSFRGFVDSGEYVSARAKIPADGIARLRRNGSYGLRGWHGGGTDAALLNLADGTGSPQVSSVWGLTEAGSLLTQNGDSLYAGGRLGGPAPPALVLTPLTCHFGPSAPAPVLFAGLATGMVGVYQLDLEIPRANVARDKLLAAGSEANYGAAGYLPITY